MSKCDCVTLCVVVCLGVNAYECEHGHPASLRSLSESFFCLKLNRSPGWGLRLGNMGLDGQGECAGLSSSQTMSIHRMGCWETPVQS